MSKLPGPSNGENYKRQRNVVIAVGGLLCVAFLMTASFFHFDWRFLSGFEMWSTYGIPTNCPISPYLSGESVKAIWVSKRNLFIEAGEPPNNGSVSTEGPTIILCTGGRWRATDGLLVRFSGQGPSAEVH